MHASRAPPGPAARMQLDEFVCCYLLTHRAGAVAAAVERRRPVVPALRRRREGRCCRRQDGEQCQDSAAHLSIYLSTMNLSSEYSIELWEPFG
jgi:tRNA U34 2-thiouridine synthase MnmA/TrmU